jgi:hypothetical protein
MNNIPKKYKYSCIRNFDIDQIFKKLENEQITKNRIIELLILDCEYKKLRLFLQPGDEIPDLDKHIKILEERIDDSDSPDKSLSKCCRKTLEVILEFEPVFIKPAKKY